MLIINYSQIGGSMNNQSIYKGISKLLLGLLLTLSVTVLIPLNKVQAQEENRPMIPRLSLMGADNDWDATWYPDGRIWIPPSIDPNKPREFLVPVFIENKWYLHEETKDIYIPDPITSFKFKVQYDSTAVRAIGVQTFGPRELNIFPDEQYKYHTLAKDFNISWMDDRDTTYRTYLNPNTPYQDKQKGRAITITGTSIKPLPASDGFVVLLYIRFMLVPKAGAPIGLASNTPLIIGTDAIWYNDLNVRKEAPFKKYRPVWKGRFVQQDYPDPGQYTGLAGVDNSAYAPKWNDEPCLPGVIYLRISDNVPRFGFILERAIGLTPQIAQISDDGSLYEMRDPITLDSATLVAPPFGVRSFRLTNEVPASRLLDIFVESDQPWLTFRTFIPRGANAKNPIAQQTTKGYINYIDNGILGDVARGTPIYGRQTNPDPEVHFQIMCDPSRINANSSELAGIYVGYITFKSHSAQISPVRLKITFIYFRNPVEWFNNTRPAGINLTLIPSGGFGKPVKLIFGTGHRATIGVDTLFGEYKYEFPMDPNKFEARFFPPPNAPEAVKLEIQNGFGNFSPDDDDNDGTPKYCVSRDIRSSDDTLQSLLFLVRLSAENPSYYPIIITWDIQDFPDGANLFIRDTANGQLFPAVNMRKATNIGGTVYSYQITDSRVRSFLIEYTPARVIDYVDEYGNPIIKKGWNFLSLPVRPINNQWNVVYPNAINKPFFWSQNQYQFDELLRVGVGYFVKYSDKIDTKFAGSYISEISVIGSGDSVKIYPGWNTIGCVSSPLSIRDITFSNFGAESPTPTEVRKNGIWAYKTNRGYEEVSELRPGLGYWIKSDAHGYLRLIARFEKSIENSHPNYKDEIVAQSVKINFADNAQHEKTLYLGLNKTLDANVFELPPVPFNDMFDVRFANNSLLEVSDNPVLKLTGVEYPVAISIQDPINKYTFVDAITGEVLGTITPSNNTIVINHSSNAVRILVSDASTDVTLAAYPNPVTSSSILRYTLPEDSDIRLAIYDALGNEIQTLQNGFVRAGEYTVSINAVNFASGQYLCKLNVNGKLAQILLLNIVK
jgi:hypothetical protein